MTSRTRRAATASVVAVAAGSGSVLAARAAARLSPNTREMWQRTNHAGRQVTLLEGPAWVAGAMTGIVAAKLLAVPESSSRAVSDGASASA